MQNDFGPEHFDPYQFAGKTARPVSADSGIAFSDYGRMHVQKILGVGRKWIPAWALDDGKFRRVLIARIYRYGSRGPLPKEPSLKTSTRIANRMERVQRNVDEKAMPQYQRQLRAVHRQHIKRAGGYAEFITAIAWRSYRLGETSTAIAEALGCKPVVVRQHLRRLNNIARQLFPEDCLPRHWSCGRKKPRV